ncbi:MAG: lysylphosphatidylglycerol synthase transmembrane domain-containing protein [Acidobacteriota bacterium]
MSNRLRFFFKASVTLGLLGFLAYRMDLSEFWKVLSSADWALVLLAGLVYFSTVAPSIVRWKAILEKFDIRTPIGKLTQICMIGYFFNMFLPSAIGGDFFRAYYLSKREARGMSTTLTSTLVDRVSGLSALLVIGCVSVLVYPVRIKGQLLAPFLLLLMALFIAGIVTLFHPGSHRLMGRLLHRFGLSRLEERFELVYRGLTQLRGSLRAILIVVAASLAVQFSVIVSMWLAALSIGIAAPFHLFLIFIPLVNLSVALPVTINGMGLREAVYYLLFSQVGVPVETAVTLSILNMVVMSMTAIPGGVVYSIYKKDPGFPAPELAN